MKKMIFFVMVFFLFSGAYYVFHNVLHQVSALPTHRNVDDQVSSILSDEERHQISLCIANIFWNQLSQYSPFYDLDVVVENLNELETGKKMPLHKHECQQQMLSLLDKISSYHACLNLKAAELYLEEIAKRKNVVEVIPHKVYYEVLQSGNDAITTPEYTFKIHLIESRLCKGEEVVIQDTRLSKRPITLVLSDTILGFAKGASGMTCGERRKIYIHPDLAYGKYGRHGFQQLMICDVEKL
ncbi:macrophage infectivity potentiator [Parachlamydia acanthamoebae UV-7]|uniref:Peptidyl-prolyl cis-trans isomerase n=1 Tax=Parachlamydia acanthamoebae (strain UV7) TaxID=765952 RepID=F8KXP5_PARAV|nr:macrophage infectivity potentiator [Parachlamydia acanthamoebae UV-7]